MKTFFGRIIAMFFGMGLFLALAIVILSGIVYNLADSDKVTINPKSVLHLDLNGEIVERASENIITPLDIVSQKGLISIKGALREAKDDDDIVGVYLDAQVLMPKGLSSLKEIREAIIDFKESGKFVMTYGEVFTESSYYVASTADEIYLAPQGYLEFNGFNAQSMFLKGTLEKLEIEPLIFRVGEYKSAIEPLIRENMSEASRLQTTQLLKSIYTDYLTQIAISRNISIDDLRHIANTMQIRNVDSTFNKGLITHIGYYDEFVLALKEKAGKEEDEKIELIDYQDYFETKMTHDEKENRIGVVLASGNITSGKGDMRSIGSDDFTKEIRKLKKDDKIKAIVIRINSPGGSALASDVMWREIKLASEEKPVIASMSDVAASGGYYIAMACDTIVANENTITGSIGIFGVLFNTYGLMKNKLGITFDNVKTGEYADIFSTVNPMTDDKKELIQQFVNEGYDVFTQKAADDRGMTQDELKKYASGRVWSGADAKEIGLIDLFGGLNEAIEIAAQAAELEDYSVKYYPKPQTWAEQLLEELSKSVSEKWYKNQLGELSPIFEELKEIEKYKGIQARMTPEIIIK